VSYIFRERDNVVKAGEAEAPRPGPRTAWCNKKFTQLWTPKFPERKIAVSVNCIYLRKEGITQIKYGRYCIYFYEGPAVSFKPRGPEAATGATNIAAPLSLLSAVVVTRLVTAMKVLANRLTGASLVRHVTGY